MTHEWVTDGVQDLDVPVKDPVQNQYFRLDGLVPPTNPPAGSQATVQVTFTCLSGKREIKVIIASKQTGGYILEQEMTLRGTTESVNLVLTTPSQGGPWNLELRWYYDGNE